MLQDQLSRLRDSTDVELEDLIRSHPYVLTKFIDDDCTFCRALAPYIQQLANDPRFLHVLFVRIHARENPKAAAAVSYTRAPFFAAYNNGQLQHCATLFTEDEVEEVLLRYLMPAGASVDATVL